MTLFLLSWLLLEVVGYVALTPFPAVRRIMGVVVVTTLLQLFRQIEGGFTVAGLHVPARPGLADFGLALGLLAILILRPRGVTGGREIGPPRLQRLRLRARETATTPQADS